MEGAPERLELIRVDRIEHRTVEDEDRVRPSVRRQVLRQGPVGFLWICSAGVPPMRAATRLAWARLGCSGAREGVEGEQAGIPLQKSVEVLEEIALQRLRGGIAGRMAPQHSLRQRESSV